MNISRRSYIRFAILMLSVLLLLLFRVPSTLMRLFALKEDDFVNHAVPSSRGSELAFNLARSAAQKQLTPLSESELVGYQESLRRDGGMGTAVILEQWSLPIEEARFWRRLSK